MAVLDRLLAAARSSNHVAIEQFVETMRLHERKELTKSLAAQVVSEDETYLPLLRSLTGCTSLRIEAITSVARAFYENTMTGVHAERGIRELQLATVGILHDEKLDSADIEEQLGKIVEQILELVTESQIIKSAVIPLSIALSAARAADDLGSPAGKQICGDTVQWVLNKNWAPSACVGLIDALTSMPIETADLQKISTKITAILKAEALSDEESLCLGKQVIGLWPKFNNDMELEWSELVRRALHGPNGNAAGDLLCLVEIESCSNVAVGQALLQSYQRVREDDMRISGRDLALAITILRGSHILYEKARRAVYDIVLAPENVLNPSYGSSSQSASVSRRKGLLLEAISLAGIEASVMSFLEIAENWMSSRIQLLNELGVEAVCIVFAHHPHARDEILSNALSILAEESNNLKLSRAMLTVLQQLADSQRMNICEHIDKFHGWMDFIVNIPLQTARKVLSTLAPFVALSPAFADALFVRFQKMITSRKVNTKLLAVHGLAETVKHLPRVDPTTAEGVFTAFRAALSRSTAELRAEVYNGISQAAKIVPALQDVASVLKIRADVLSRLQTCTDKCGRIDFGSAIVNICGDIKLREPLPELFKCVIHLDGLGSVSGILSTISSPEPLIHEILKLSPELQDVAFTTMTQVCAGALEARVFKDRQTTSRVLEMYAALTTIRVKKRSGRQRRLSSSMKASDIESMALSGLNGMDNERTKSLLTFSTCLRLLQDLQGPHHAPIAVTLLGAMIECLHADIGCLSGRTAFPMLQICLQWLKHEAPREDLDELSLYTSLINIAKVDDSSQPTHQKALQALICAVEQANFFDLLDATRAFKELETLFAHEKAGFEKLKNSAPSGLLLAILHQFELEFASSMSSDLASSYLLLMRKLLEIAEDDLLAHVAETILSVFDKYIVSQAAIVRGMLDIIFASLDIQEGLELAKGILSDCREENPDCEDEERMGINAIDDEILDEAFLMEGGSTSVSVRLRWFRRGKSLYISQEENCRQMALTMTLSYLHQVLSATVKSLNVDVDSVKDVADALRILLLSKGRRQFKAKTTGKRRTTVLELTHASKAIRLVTLILRMATSECFVLQAKIRKKDLVDVNSHLYVVSQVQSKFDVQKNATGLLANFLCSQGRNLPPGNSFLHRAKYQLERFNLGLKALLELVQKHGFDGDERAKQSLTKLGSRFQSRKAKGNRRDRRSNEPLEDAQKLVFLRKSEASGRKRKRLRSRNSYIDQYLDQESGDDNYADLEDFLVAEDTVVETEGHSDSEVESNPRG
mmetsp:Transcript_4909/g.14792  ORF Transcript_4909/g.14792 Transcript_4909/m.14792 type:complete len:1277 (+) Transcript_4909:140-3970(+)